MSEQPIEDLPDNQINPPKSSVNRFSKKAMNGLVWASSTSAFTQIVNWVFTIMTARILAPSDYGTMALVQTFFPYLLMVTNFNMEPWFLHLESMNKEKEKSVFTLAFIFGSISSVFCFLIAPYVGQFYDNSDVVLAVQIMSINFIFYGLAMVPTSRLKRALEFKTISLVNTFVGITQVILVFILALNDFGLMSLVIGYTYKVVASTICFIFVGGGLPGFGWSQNVIKSIIKFGSQATGANILFIIFSTADEVIIGKFLGVDILGYYSMAFYLMSMPSNKIADIIKPLLLSYFSRIKSFKDKFVTIFLDITKFCAWIIFPILIGMSAVSNEFVLTVFGEKWAPMAWPLSVLCIAGLFRTLTDTIYSLIMAHGRPDIDFKINLVSAIIFPISFYFMIIEFGLNGALLVWIVIYPLIPYLNIRELKKLIGLKIRGYAVALIKPIIFTLAMYGVLYLFHVAFVNNLSQIYLLIIKVMLGMIIYSLLSFFFFNKEIKNALKLMKEK